MSQTIFRSKVDGWLVGLVGGSLVLALAGVSVAAVSVDDPTVWIGVVAVVLAGALVGWLFASTRYELDGRTLTARSGPFRWRVDLATVDAVTPTRSPLSSPALSLDRLAIRYGKGRTILVSPAERDRFLAALARAEPALERHQGGLRRRA
jgi:hypothetical protein